MTFVDTPNTPESNPKGSGVSWKRELFSWARCILGALLIVAVLRIFVFALIRVDGDSMRETLHDGDRLLVTLYDGRWGLGELSRRDVVICRYPEADHLSVKRIIGLPGETVELFMGQLFIDGEMMDEDYLTYFDYRAFGPVTLGEDEYLVMGDNRPRSRDSRSADVGPLKRSEIKGKVRMVLWPEFKKIE